MRHYMRRARTDAHCRVDSTRPTRHAVHVTDREAKRLAAAVIAVRERLNLTQEEFAARCQLSLTTISRVERGTAGPRTKTFAGLDRGAGWLPGSSRGVYTTGDEPVMAEDLRDDNERKLWALDLPVDVRRGYIDRYRADQRAAQTGQ